MSGYVNCACRDCMEIAIGDNDAMCSACAAAGCELDAECCAGCDGDDEEIELPVCPLDGGVGVPLGALGNRLHFRCRQCGMNFSHERRAAG